jgi:hypothetical protein
MDLDIFLFMETCQVAMEPGILAVLPVLSVLFPNIQIVRPFPTTK